MTSNPEKFAEFFGLLSALRDEVITDAQFAQLDKLLTANPEAQQYYVEYIMLCVELRKYQALNGGNEPQAEDIMRETLEQSENISAQHAAEEDQRKAEAMRNTAKKTAEEAFREFQDKEARRLEKVFYKRHFRNMRRLAYGVSVLAASLIIVILVRFLNTRPQSPAPVAPPIVAKIIQSIDAQWGDSGISTVPGTQLTASTMQLKRGLIQIVFESGAEVILQAPCKVKPENANQIFLLSGNMTAIVPDKAIGFTVRTSVATMVDYGTEFGVMANASGETEVHVFKGEVDLRSGPDARVFEKSQRIKTCQAGMVDSQGSLSTRKIKYQAKRFIRQMPANSRFGRPGKRMDLADIIGGGNGFGTGDPNQSINPDNGQRQSGFYPHNHTDIGGTSDYVPIADLDFIDGVFIPDGGDGPVVISSDGHTFNDCPDTDSTFCWDIFNGDATNLDDQYRTLLDGKQYGTFIHPAITVHSNAGITFDLDKIRASLPGTRIVSFVSLCGIGDHSVHDISFSADFWVLVDGQKRFEWKGAARQHKARNIRIRLNEQDKFLTLVVTDGGKLREDTNAIGRDWGIFANAALMLEDRR